MIGSPLSPRRLRSLPRPHSTQWTAQRRPSKPTLARSLLRLHISLHRWSCLSLRLRPGPCLRSSPHTRLHLLAAITQTPGPSSPTPRLPLPRPRHPRHLARKSRTSLRLYLRYNLNNTSAPHQAPGMRTSIGWRATSIRSSPITQSPRSQSAKPQRDQAVLSERNPSPSCSYYTKDFHFKSHDSTKARFCFCRLTLHELWTRFIDQALPRNRKESPGS